MNSLFNCRVSKQESDRWLAHLKRCGFTTVDTDKGGMLETIQTAVYNPDGSINTNYGATSFMDAEKGRRVYFIQMRVT